MRTAGDGDGRGSAVVGIELDLNFTGGWVGFVFV